MHKISIHGQTFYQLDEVECDFEISYVIKAALMTKWEREKPSDFVHCSPSFSKEGMFLFGVRGMLLVDEKPNFEKWYLLQNVISISRINFRDKEYEKHFSQFNRFEEISLTSNPSIIIKGMKLLQRRLNSNMPKVHPYDQWGALINNNNLSFLPPIGNIPTYAYDDVNALPHQTIDLQKSSIISLTRKRKIKLTK